MRHRLFLLLILSMTVTSFSIKLKAILEWKFVDYVWDPEQKQNVINSGNYIPSICILYDIDKADDDRIFATVPKKVGPTPASLVTVSDAMGPRGPLLEPYPNWSWHNNSCTCNERSITYVHRFLIKCNYLFTMDNGKVGPIQVCNPKLLIFDLSTDTLVKTISMPLDFATDKEGSGLMMTPVVYCEDCSRLLETMIIFMSEKKGYGLVVYDARRQHMCRVEGEKMKPTDMSFSIAGYNFTYDGGIYGMTIVRNELFYAVLSGKEIYKIPIKELLKCPNKEKADKKSKLVKKLSSQTGLLASAGCELFLGDTRGISLLAGDACKKCGCMNMVEIVQDSEQLQARSGLKFSSRRNQLVILSDKFQRFVTLSVDLNETNFRYFEIDLEKIPQVFGT